MCNVFISIKTIIKQKQIQFVKKLKKLLPQCEKNDDSVSVVNSKYNCIKTN